jgi:hypothetical protein
MARSPCKDERSLGQAQLQLAEVVVIRGSHVVEVQCLRQVSGKLSLDQELCGGLDDAGFGQPLKPWSLDNIGARLDQDVDPLLALADSDQVVMAPQWFDV